jgi:hypothetical protein
MTFSFAEKGFRKREILLVGTVVMCSWNIGAAPGATTSARAEGRSLFTPVVE